MKTLKLSLSIFFLILIITGCETEGDNIHEASLTGLEVKIAFQDDATIQYRATWNDKEILRSGKTDSTITISRDSLSGTLKVYKNNETEPELEKQMTISPGYTISLVQLPGSPIIINSGEDEADPSNRTSVKVRFMYSDMPGWGDSVKVDIFVYISDPDGVKSTRSTGVSVIVKERELSPYVELDLNQFVSDLTRYERTRTYVTDVTDIATGTLLVDHTTSSTGQIGQISFGSKRWVNDTGWKPSQKFSTCYAYLNPNTNKISFQFGFGAPW